MSEHLIPARFAGRPNRFVVRAVLSDGTAVEAHLADPGRLTELLLPGAALRLRAVPSAAVRRTRYDTVLVRSSVAPRPWVSLETTRANRLAEELIAAGRLRGLRGAVSREVRDGASRFDFRLDDDGRVTWVEVKSVTLVEDGVGLFPDAPTARGRRHVDELAAKARAGEGACVLFVAQRADAASVRPHRGIDPEFAAALAQARQAGVQLRAVRFGLDERGGAEYLGSIPVRR